MSVSVCAVEGKNIPKGENIRERSADPVDENEKPFTPTVQE
jgi:hypothetical protein